MGSEPEDLDGGPDGFLDTESEPLYRATEEAVMGDGSPVAGMPCAEEEDIFIPNCKSCDKTLTDPDDRVVVDGEFHYKKDGGSLLWYKQQVKMGNFSVDIES